MKIRLFRALAPFAKCVHCPLCHLHREDVLAAGRTTDIATAVIRSLNHENSLSILEILQPIIHLNLKVLGPSPEDLLKQELAKAASGTN